jgi:hypothetical protein
MIAHEEYQKPKLRMGAKMSAMPTAQERINAGLMMARRRSRSIFLKRSDSAEPTATWQ